MEEGEVGGGKREAENEQAQASRDEAPGAPLADGEGLDKRQVKREEESDGRDDEQTEDQQGNLMERREA